jgi:hypothetical protein
MAWPIGNNQYRYRNEKLAALARHGAAARRSILSGNGGWLSTANVKLKWLAKYGSGCCMAIG